MRLTVHIELDRESMKTTAGVAEALEMLAGAIAELATETNRLYLFGGPVHDANCERVGTWGIEPSTVELTDFPNIGKETPKR